LPLADDCHVPHARAVVHTWTEIDVRAVLSGPAAAAIPRKEGACRHLVQFHEQGLFTVRLPALTAVDAGEIDAGAGPLSSAKRGGSRVLIVDDNEDASELLAETLSNAGYETAVAYDGPEALRSAAASPPDVALIDIGLPVMDGYELAARLREERPPGDLRLIALTGYGQESDRERSRNVGFDLHLVKPVDLDTLMRAIEATAE
jgi:CheY-like chemotaxis protein